MKRTPTPWHLEATWDEHCDISIWSDDDSVIEWTETISHKEKEKANAEFIVRAVNNHENLLDALKATLDFLDKGLYMNTARMARAAIKQAEES